MASTNYTLRIDEGDKRQAEQVFKSLGMNLSTGINIYIKAVGRQQKIPFELDLKDRAADGAASGAKREEKEQAYKALSGILAGHKVNLNEEREERILSK